MRSRWRQMFFTWFQCTVCILPLAVFAESPPVVPASALMRVRIGGDGTIGSDGTESHRKKVVANILLLEQELLRQNRSPQRQQKRQPKHPSELYFRPVSVTFWCVMVLTLQGLALYTALALSRNLDELGGRLHVSSTTATLEVAARSVLLCAMVSMTFISCRLYVFARTEGLGETPVWVKACMIISTVGITLQNLHVFLLPAVVDERAFEIASLPVITGEFSDAHPLLQTFDFKESSMFDCFRRYQFLVVGMIYGGSFGVVMGVLTVPSHTTSVSTAVIATCTLGVLYLLVSLFLHSVSLFRNATNCRRERETKDNYYRLIRFARKPFLGDDDSLTTEIARRKSNDSFISAARAMSTSARKAPMLGALFIAARFRAVHVNPPHGVPQYWGEPVFLVVTIALFFEVIAAAFVGTAGREEAAYYGVYMYMDAGIAGSVRHIFGGLVYAGLIPIFASFFQATNSDGSIAPLPRMTMSLLWLAALFFIIEFIQWAVFLLLDVFKKRWFVLRNTVLAAGVGVGFAPLFSIVSIACRLRALQITKRQGSPQVWAQDLLDMSVFAIFLQVTCCIVMPVFVDAATRVDADGHAEYNARPLVGSFCVTLVRYVASMGLHIGLLGQFIAVFTITPETANTDENTFRSSEFLRMLLITLVITLISIVLSFPQVVGLAAKLAIEEVEETFLGTSIEIAKAKLNIFEGSVNIGGVKVHNPQPIAENKPWRCDHLLTFDRVVLKLDMWKLISSFGHTFEITDVSLKGTEVHYERQTTKENSNICCVVAHTPVTQDLYRPKVVLHKVSVQSARSLIIPRAFMGPTLATKVENIEFDDLNKSLQEKKLRTVASMVTTILKTILLRVRETTLSNLEHHSNDDRHLAGHTLMKRVGQLCAK
eukprot:TRINITY_DN30935_c0_g1_i1.p1 TRINITY_DN30935_c0_g1~~TRINITY_DN30935_c0_g1_i1.p1  ORF type:complete len:883 (-),score=115.14 TRINITY_DN30935_c0_g1_i1:25-2673(-)